MAIAAILLMAGAGERFGASSLPKQFQLLGGKPLYLHTLETFEQAGLFQEIVLVCPQHWIPQVQQTVQGRPVRVVAGGATRQASSYAGLLACAPGTLQVVIHDAVRPFVSIDILRQNVEAVQLHPAVDTCIPSTDTLVRTTGTHHIEDIPDRSLWMRGQTPQSFSIALLQAAHEQALQRGVTNSTDDCALALGLGVSPYIVLGSEENIKITTPLDLILAEQLLLSRVKQLAPVAGSLQGKRIVVTGGTGAIGSAVLSLLKEEGAEGICVSRSAPIYRADLSQHEEVKRLFAELGPLDGLVNSIGYLKTAPLQELSAPEIEAHIAINFTSVVYSCLYAQVRAGGHIVNIASSSYSRGRKRYALYSAAKAALVNFTQGLAEERPELCINTLIPHRTRSTLRLSNFGEEDPSTLLDPHEVAQEIVALLQQTHLTGSLWTVRKLPARLGAPHKEDEATTGKRRDERGDLVHNRQ